MLIPKFLQRIGWVFVLGLCSLTVRAADTLIRLPIETYFAEPDIRSMQLAPDGKHLAFLTTLGWGKVGVALMDLTTGKIEPLVSAQDENIKIFLWKGSDYIVYAGDTGGDESYAWRSVPIAEPKPGKKRVVVALSEAYRERYQEDANVMSIIDPLKFDPQHLLISGRSGTGSRGGGVYLIDVRNGRRTPTINSEVPPGYRGGDLGVWADNRGEMRVFRQVAGKRVTIRVRPEGAPVFKTVKEFPSELGGWEPLSFAPDNETLYLISTEQNPRGVLHTFNIRTQKLSDPIFTAPEGTITGLMQSWDHTRLLGVTYLAEKPYRKFFNAARAQLQQSIDGALPDTINDIVGTSQDERILLIRAWNDREPGTYYVLDRNRSKMGPVGRAMRGIEPAKMRPMEPIKFTARDGLTIHGYLTRPAAAVGQKVPLIINPHGGPYGIRDEWGFNPEVQLLANRGYAVLQVNYRGSGGYGEDFLRAGWHEWGGKMQDDLSDAVKWAIDQGMVDPSRVAIYGASYGGYATLAGLTFTPELYCCGANYVGPSDLGILAERANSGASSDANFFGDWMGDDKEYLRTHSPLNYVERIRVPLFNAYGYNDPRVDIRHWTKLESKLKQFNKSYEIMIEGNEGHGFRNENNRIAFYTRLEDFLGRNLAPGTSVKIPELKVLELPAKP
jgi:dipeptidyl aminopeptidase/acylaminoacyl peptidase